MPLLIAAVLLCACNDSPTGPSVALTGSWQGVVDPPLTSAFFMEMTLQEADGEVTGSTTLSRSGEVVFSLTVTGIHVKGSFSLTLDADEVTPFVYTGEIDGDVLRGQFNGSGFQNLDVTMERVEGG